MFHSGVGFIIVDVPTDGWCLISAGWLVQKLKCLARIKVVNEISRLILKC